jgi:hypothetical protein
MPTPHPTQSVILYPQIQAAIAKLMQATGQHKSAVLKEAVEVGLSVLQDRHGLTSSKRVSEITEDQLRSIVRQEVAVALREDIEVNPAAT